MTDNTDRETRLLAQENLPLDLGELGAVIQADLVMPGVYDTALEIPETGLIVEAYVVLKTAIEISETAKKYGKVPPGYSEFLVYMEDNTGRNSRYIIDYELIRYKILHQPPLPEHENIRSTASIGAEMYPEYFGHYPVPFLTP